MLIDRSSGLSSKILSHPRRQTPQSMEIGHREERCHVIGECTHNQILHEDLIGRRHELELVFLAEPSIAHLPPPSSRNAGAIRAHRVAGISIRSHSAPPSCNASKMWLRFLNGVDICISDRRRRPASNAPHPAHRGNRGIRRYRSRIAWWL